MRAADKHNAVQEARAARGALGVGLDAPLPDIVDLLEEAAGIPVTVLPLPDGVAGAYGRKEERPFIFVNSNDHPVRRRFTLAHEYGHHRLHRRGVIDRHDDLYGKKTRRPEEAEANYFASEFLAPVQAVHNWVDARGIDAFDLGTILRLGHYFGISAMAARIRLEEAGFLPYPRQRKELDDAIAAGDHAGLAGTLGIRELDDSLALPKLAFGGWRIPQPVFRRARRVYEFGLLPLEKLSEQVGGEAAHLDRELERVGAVAPEIDDED